MLFTLMFTLASLFIFMVAVLVIGVFAVTIFKGIAQWQSNNAQPVRTVPALVVTKRQHVSGSGHDSSTSTWYYVTFDTVADGLRQEFSVRSVDYSGLAEGDTGDLTYQGTRYKGFLRVRRLAASPTPATVPHVSSWICGYCGGAVSPDSPKCLACGSSQRAAAPVSA